MPLDRIDVHQLLWPEPFVSALYRRADPPTLRRSSGAWRLWLAGEPDAPLDLAALIRPGGELARHSMSYAEELRPVDVSVG